MDRDSRISPKPRRRSEANAAGLQIKTTTQGAVENSLVPMQSGPWHADAPCSQKINKRQRLSGFRDIIMLPWRVIGRNAVKVASSCGI